MAAFVVPAVQRRCALEAVAATTIIGHQFTGGELAFRPRRRRQQRFRSAGDSIRRDHQENDPIAVKGHDPHSVGGQISISVQTNRVPAEPRAPRRRPPGIQVVHDPVDAVGPVAQQSLQIGYFSDQVVGVRPPGPINRPGARNGRRRRRAYCGRTMAERKPCRAFQQDRLEMSRHHDAPDRDRVAAPVHWPGDDETTDGSYEKPPTPSSLPARGETATGPPEPAAADPHFRSNRSAFITLFHAATKSATNFSFASSVAYTSANARNCEFDPNTKSTRLAVHFGAPDTRSLPT